MSVGGDGEILSVVGVHKRFGGVHALRGASLNLRAGEIHTLVGENGSGKSTLLKIIGGQLRPDEGRLVLDGEEVVLRDPPTALARGIVSVTQETTLAPELSIAENIFLGGRMSRGRLGIDWKTTRLRARELLERLGVDLDESLPVRRLRPDQQQMVEIARAISMETRILILDEPTSSLTDDEVAALFTVVRRLRDQGIAIVFVSHRLGELFQLASHYTVLRDGLTVGSGSLTEIDRDGLVSVMIGRAHRESDTHASDNATDLNKPALRLEDLSVPGVVEEVSLEVRQGEIVGLAGLVGAGRSELLEAVFGLHRDSTGTIELGGAPVRLRGPRDAIQRGLALIPADRKGLGLVLTRSVRENIMMVANAHRPRIAVPRRRRELRLVHEALERLRIVAASPSVDVATLSGGNQQKVVIAKWLTRQPAVMMLDEPTRGVDVGAKAEIYRLLRGAAADGIGILVSSSETPELLVLCDRILVMFRGRLVHELSREQASEAAIARFVAGHL